jgi:hypothetical protein
LRTSPANETPRDTLGEGLRPAIFDRDTAAMIVYTSNDRHETANARRRGKLMIRSVVVAVLLGAMFMATDAVAMSPGKMIKQATFTRKHPEKDRAACAEKATQKGYTEKAPRKAFIRKCLRSQ